MTDQDLSLFPSLAIARAAFPNLPPLANSFMAKLFPDYKVFGDIPRADSAVATLLKRRPPAELASQIRDLFGSSEGKWSAATTELLALSLLDSDGLLDQIGWPSGFPGDTPPFEGSLLDTAGAKAALAFDVKNAANVGLNMLEDAFAPVAERWRTTHNLPEVEIEFDSTGPVTLEVLGREKARLVKGFDAGLQRAAALPVTLTLTAGPNTELIVIVRQATGSRMSIAVTRTDTRAQSIANVVRGHVSSKAKQAALHNGSFLILYVRPPSRGNADVKLRDLELALPDLDRDRALMAEPGVNRWLGTVLPDWAPSPDAPRRHGHLRPSAMWPAGSSPDTLARSLRLTPWA